MIVRPPMSIADFYSRFAEWADSVLAESVPDGVVAFSVSLYEGVGTFDVQINGAPTFDLNDDDWACEVVYSTGEDLFQIPREQVGNRWESALELVLELVKRYLSSGGRAETLRAGRAVAVGFVDGDLHLVWPGAAA